MEHVPETILPVIEGTSAFSTNLKRFASLQGFTGGYFHRLAGGFHQHLLGETLGFGHIFRTYEMFPQLIQRILAKGFGVTMGVLRTDTGDQRNSLIPQFPSFLNVSTASLVMTNTPPIPATQCQNPAFELAIQR